MTAPQWLILYQLICLALLIGQGGVLLWIVFVLKALPQSAVNVRSILGAVQGHTAILVARIEEARARIENIGVSQELDSAAIKNALFGIVEMIDVYVLRISGPRPRPEKRP